MAAGPGRPLVPGGLPGGGRRAAALAGRRVFLTTGRTGLGAFADAAPGLWFLLRSVDPPVGPGPGECEVLLDRGPFTLEGERELLRTYGVEVLVTKDSGGEATAPKLTAAREAGIPVVVVRRPPVPEGCRWWARRRRRWRGWAVGEPPGGRGQGRGRAARRPRRAARTELRRTPPCLRGCSPVTEWRGGPQAPVVGSG
ncbi:precorrin-6A/cobalt-precorrin-6A reductase [Actinomadura keratinilytica]